MNPKKRRKRLGAVGKQGGWGGNQGVPWEVNARLLKDMGAQLPPIVPVLADILLPG